MNRRRLRALPTIADMAKAFGAVDAMFVRLADGWIHEIQGNAVFRNPADAKWYDIPEALAGWIALWERIAAHQSLDIDLAPLARLNARLRYGTPITPEDVAAGTAIITACKKAYRRMDIYDIGSLVKTQLIANELENRGLAAQTS